MFVCGITKAFHVIQEKSRDGYNSTERMSAVTIHNNANLSWYGAKMGLTYLQWFIFFFGNSGLEIKDARHNGRC